MKQHKFYIDSHKESEPPATPGGRERSHNMLDRFAIDRARVSSYDARDGAWFDVQRLDGQVALAGPVAAVRAERRERRREVAYRLGLSDTFALANKAGVATSSWHGSTLATRARATISRSSTWRVSPARIASAQAIQKTR